MQTKVQKTEGGVEYFVLYEKREKCVEQKSKGDFVFLRRISNNQPCIIKVPILGNNSIKR